MHHLDKFRIRIELLKCNILSIANHSKMMLERDFTLYYYANQ